MMPQPGSRVKIFFKGSMNAEGIVESWGQKAVLKSLEDDSILIIQNTSEDIVAIKVYGSAVPNKKQEKPNKEIKESLQKKQEIDKEFDKVLSSESNDMRLNSLVELRKLQSIQDKKIISEKLKEHSIVDAKPVTYEQPRFLKK